MTRALVALLLLCAGCSTTRGVMPHAGTSGFAAAPGGAHPLNAQAADSSWLSYTVPRFGSLDCAPDTSLPLHDPLRVAVLRLRGQAVAYRPGCEAAAACWDSVRAQTVPDTTWRRGLWPGQRDSLRVDAGQYVAIPFNRAGPARCGWRVVVH